MGTLLAPGELAVFLQHPVKAGTEDMAIRVAEGWLMSATRLAAWPDPVPQDLWAWALELAGIAYENPQGLATRTAGEETTAWALARRKEILAAAAEAYPAAVPVGNFPPAPCWPL